MKNILNEKTVEAVPPVPAIVDVKEKLTAKQIAENIIGAVDWISDSEGLCECPGKQMHTAQEGRRDCMIYLDPVLTLNCFHSSCRTAVDFTNKKLRQATLGGTTEKKRLTDEDKARIKETNRRNDVRKRAAGSRGAILKNHRWTYDQIIQASPVDLKSNVVDHWKLLLGCFRKEDVVWIGDKFDSGKKENEDHFLPVSEWLNLKCAPGSLVCAATFCAGSYSRNNDNVVARRFLVVESDVLGRDEVGAIFRWMQKEVQLQLRAIVDTAGKSLHAWFDYPPDYLVEELKLILPELGCDSKLFTASQPVRLPSAIRDGKHQKLIYLSKEAAV